MIVESEERKETECSYLEIFLASIVFSDPSKLIFMDQMIRIMRATTGCGLLKSVLSIGKLDVSVVD
jgi:hypothetical protein